MYSQNLSSITENVLFQEIIQGRNCSTLFRHELQVLQNDTPLETHLITEKAKLFLSKQSFALGSYTRHYTAAALYSLNRVSLYTRPTEVGISVHSIAFGMTSVCSP